MNGIPQTDDTIAAISTPIGQAGIGIVRMSGPMAFDIAKKVFRHRRRPKVIKSHHLYLGDFIDPDSGRMIDEVLLSYMKAPNTYTREDMVEINSHSGHLILSKILEIVLHSGARLARPGEFTYRAFINGRLDLTQAEAVLDIINASSEKALQLASRLIKGGLRERIHKLRSHLIDILSHLEVAIDFPDEVEEILSFDEMARRIRKDILSELNEILDSHINRKIWMDGINTVIVGKVNVGKSSILNRLSNEEKAIVTPIPGTTRDIIESIIHIDGIPLKLMDTAGFRKAQNEVEKIGLRLTKEKLSNADLILLVLDQSQPLSSEDMSILKKSPRTNTVVIFNKIDLPPSKDFKKLSSELSQYRIVRTCALSGEGIEDLISSIKDMILKGRIEGDLSGIAPNLRHKSVLLKTRDYLTSGMENLTNNAPLEIIADDIRSALDTLGEITGETATEEVLENIFNSFCIGK
jgi:tRNA modification GTPase